MANIDIKKIYEWPIAAQIFAMCLFGLLVFYLGYMFDLSPMRTGLVASRAQEDQLKESYKAMVKEHVSSLNAVMQVPRLKDLLKTWRMKFAKPEDLAPLQDKILSLAEVYQLKVNSFVPGEEKKVGIYNTQPVRIEVIGTFVQAASFMSQIANLNRLIVISDFEMDSINPGGMGQPAPINSDNPVDTTFNIVIYKY